MHKNFEEGESRLFDIWVLFVRSKIFVKKTNKKDKQTWNCLDSLILLYYWVKNLLVISADFEQAKNSSWRNSLTYGTPCHATDQFCFLVSSCFLEKAMPWQWSSSDQQRVLRMWESVFYFRRFLRYTSFCVLRSYKRVTKLAGLHADLQKIVPAQLLVWITTIYKRGMMVGSI